MYKYKIFDMGNKITCTLKRNYRTAVTIIILETCLFQIYDFNNSHRGGK